MLSLRVNGREHSVSAEPTQPLLEVLRDQLGLASVREGCGLGVCGTCTVLMNGRLVSSCLIMAAQAQGREVVTLEGIAPVGELHPVQRAFLEAHAFQCAFCTPAFILSTIALLQENPHPSDEVVRNHLAGNLCRCGSYRSILQAVRIAAGADGDRNPP